MSVPVRNLATRCRCMADVALRPDVPGGRARSAAEGAADRAAAGAGQRRRDRSAARSRASSSARRIATAPRPTACRRRIEAFTVDDLRAFYRAHYRPDNATLLVVGDVTPAAVLPHAGEGVRRLEDRRAWRRWSPACPHAPQLTQARRSYLVDKPGAAQSQIRIGWVGVPRSTPDYATLEVLNTMLGGSFTSRLNQNLREKNGYTYGASSAFDMRPSAGPFFAAAGVQTDKTADALKEFFVELERHPQADSGRRAREGEELRRARVSRASSRPPATSRSKLEELVVYNLPDDDVHRIRGERRRR